ncbi:MAG: hypothetical protein HXS44_16090 [Theionarchaea archaeon]|nr:hypothetical protein [Theionarchaea archaeon]
MEFSQASLQNIFWGILIIIVAAVLISIGILGLPILMIVPLGILGIGILILATGASYYVRAWGIVMAVAGGLWLSRWVFPLSLVVTAGIFLAVVGALVVVGSRQ